MYREIVSTLLLLALPFLAVPLTAQERAEPAYDASSIYAIIDQNEWCPGGAVHIDLSSGAYVLMPRPKRSDCRNPEFERRAMLTGNLDLADLAALRDANRAVVEQGIEREECLLILSNGGREVLALTGPEWAMVTPKDEGCWTKEARAMHDLIFGLFAEQ